MKVNKKEVLKKLYPIFCKFFGNKNIKLTYTSSSKNISKWDSLAQINLVVETEKLFKIKFSVSDLSNLKDVGEMIDLIIKKNEKL
jgi:acyl carrier protein